MGSCGSDACSAKNVPSYGPLEFPGTEEVNKIRDRGSARIMQNKCILQFSKSQKPMCVLKSVYCGMSGRTQTVQGPIPASTASSLFFAGGTTMGLTLPAWQIVAAANEGKGSCRPWARDVTLELTCCQHPPAGHWQDSNNALLAYMGQFLEQDCEWLLSTGT